MHHFIIICEFKLELQSGNGQVGSWPLWPWHLTSDLDLLHGRYPGPWWYLLKISWWYDDGNIVKKVWRTDRRRDRQTENTIHRAAWSQLKTANATRKSRKTYLGITMRSLGFQNFQQCCFRLPDWWYNSTHWMGRFFLANVLMIHLDSFCLVIPLAGPSPKLGPHLFRIWAYSSGTN